MREQIPTLTLGLMCTFHKKTIGSVEKARSQITDVAKCSLSRNQLLNRPDSQKKSVFHSHLAEGERGRERERERDTEKRIESPPWNIPTAA